MTDISEIAVFGPGLLGGSLLAALRQDFPDARLRVWARRQGAVDTVLARGWADVGSIDPATAAAGADLVILATPVGSMGALAAEIATASPGAAALVTDVGSVKASVEKQVRPALAGSGWTFVGSHPMAGSERAGIEAARASLFRGAACFVMNAPTPAAAQLATFWQRLGCRVLSTDPENHDHWVASISHLPHVAAAAITHAAIGRQEDYLPGAAGGFRDTTRIASGDATLWTEILLENRDAVITSLRVLQTQITAAIHQLEDQDPEGLYSWLAEAKRLRDLMGQALPTTTFGRDRRPVPPNG
jgi:prephenate dehydrogenase